jgi:hypothetical protein
MRAAMNASPYLLRTGCRRRLPWLELIWADAGYNAWQVEAAVADMPVCAWRLSNGRTT